MLKRILPIIIGIGLIAGCQSKGKQETTTNAPAAPATPAPVAGAESYPSLPVDTLKMLWEKCDYIDFIPYEFSFTMSQNEKSAIQSMLGHIATEVPVINPACQPMGRIFYQVDGKNALEADLYIGDECIYYIFYEKGKKAYANKLTDQGIQFFRSIFSQAIEGLKKQQGQ